MPTLRILSFTSLLAWTLGFSPLAAQEPLKNDRVVSKTAEDFSGELWTLSQYNKAAGDVSRGAGSPLAPGSKDSMHFNVHFSGTGDFEHFAIAPSRPLYFPGNIKTIRVRMRRSDPRCNIAYNFIDGWGRTSDGQALSWSPKVTGTDWELVTFQVPDNWVRPVGLASINCHNYETKGDKTTASFALDDIEVETDLTDVDPVTGLLKTWKPEEHPTDPQKALKQPPSTPLLTIQLSTPERGNVFAGAKPSLQLQVKNWFPQNASGRVTFSVTDQSGGAIRSWTQELNVVSAETFAFPLDLPRFGLYETKASLALANQPPLEKKVTLAVLPVRPELTQEQKLASPYGINYHGGGERIFSPFKKAGLVWFRDYAFTLEWMRRAKGADRRYAGWPSYPALIGEYEKEGLMLLPILGAIEPPEKQEGKPDRIGPNEAWNREIADILIAFPHIRYWELANEYDLKAENMEAERAVKWQNYQLYHKKFAEIANVLSDGRVGTVENGRAGIYPVFVRDEVTSGNFADIQVINSHHYCGTDAPEVNVENFNMGKTLAEGRIPGSFFDNLRAVKKEAQADGKARQSWLTEFGWDTLAGPIVSPQQQAAYLQRGFLAAFAAGTDKAFWFFHFDAAKAVQFFDGCGLMTHDQQPKLSLVAMAGLTTILPRPKFVGSIEAGPGTAGWVFENDGKLVAGLWTLPGGEASKVSFQAETVRDYLNNPLPGKEAVLSEMPIYAIGLKQTDPLFLQTAYHLESNHYLAATAGDPVTAVVLVKNNRSTELRCEIHAALPEGWISTNPKVSATVPPGNEVELSIPFVVGKSEGLGVKPVSFQISEAGKQVKTMGMDVSVKAPFLIEVGPLLGEPGASNVEVLLTNKTASPKGGHLTLSLPEGWQTASQKIHVPEMPPGEQYRQTIALVWQPNWKEHESAIVRFQSEGLPDVEASIIPRKLKLHRATEIKLDGQLADWSTPLELPKWLLGSTIGSAKARLWLGWSPEGIYGAAEVLDSKTQVPDPQSFWGGDALELFISLKRAKSNRIEKGDYQLWLAPLLRENRVYVGQWKMKEEIEKTRYDLPGVKSAVRATQDGYIMEFFLPAQVFAGYDIKPGDLLGMNLNLSARGRQFDREVYWPAPKNKQTQVNPNSWGSMIVE